MLRALSVASGCQPAGGWRTMRETPAICHDRAQSPAESGCGGTRIRASSSIGRRIGLTAEPRRIRTTPIGKRSSRSVKAVVMILVGMAQEDGVDPAHACAPTAPAR